MSQYGSYFGAPQQQGGGFGGLQGVTSTLSQVNNPQALSAYENPTYANLPGGSQTGGSAYTPNSFSNLVPSNANSTNPNLSLIYQEQQTGQ
jgi:hypothetical protein